MSYFIAHSISISKTKGITFTGDDNNVWPREDRLVTIPYTEDRLKETMRELLNGCLQPVNSANDYRWWWIMKELAAANLTDIEKQFELFKRLLEQKNTGKFRVRLHDRYIKRRGKGFSYAWGTDDATQFSFFSAQYVAAKYHNYPVTIEPV